MSKNHEVTAGEGQWDYLLLFMVFLFVVSIWTMIYTNWFTVHKYYRLHISNEDKQTLCGDKGVKTSLARAADGTVLFGDQERHKVSLVCGSQTWKSNLKELTDIQAVRLINQLSVDEKTKSELLSNYTSFLVDFQLSKQMTDQAQFLQKNKITKISMSDKASKVDVENYPYLIDIKECIFSTSDDSSNVIENFGGIVFAEPWVRDKYKFSSEQFKQMVKRNIQCIKNHWHAYQKQIDQGISNKQSWSKEAI